MGLDPFNGTALELLLAAISHSKPKWAKWGETQQHHSFIQQTEVNMGGRVKLKKLRTSLKLTGRSSAVCSTVTEKSKLVTR